MRRCACNGKWPRWKHHTQKFCCRSDIGLLRHRVEVAEKWVVKEAMDEASTNAALGMNDDSDLHKACVRLHRAREKAKKHDLTS